MTKMKKRYYKYGPHSCYSYMKPVGHGFEVGFVFDKHPTFVGNFIHSEEAVMWYKYMNKEVWNFAKKFPYAKEMPFSWYKKFFSHDLYSHYYSFLDKHFAKYHREYEKALFYDYKYYRKCMPEHVVPFPFKKVA